MVPTTRKALYLLARILLQIAITRANNKKIGENAEMVTWPAFVTSRAVVALVLPLLPAVAVAAVVVPIHLRIIITRANNKKIGESAENLGWHLTVIPLADAVPVVVLVVVAQMSLQITITRANNKKIGESAENLGWQDIASKVVEDVVPVPPKEQKVLKPDLAITQMEVAARELLPELPLVELFWWLVLPWLPFSFSVVPKTLKACRLLPEP